MNATLEQRRRTAAGLLSLALQVETAHVKRDRYARNGERSRTALAVIHSWPSMQRSMAQMRDHRVFEEAQKLNNLGDGRAVFLVQSTRKSHQTLKRCGVRRQIRFNFYQVIAQYDTLGCWIAWAPPAEDALESEVVA